MTIRSPISPISPFKLERYFAQWEFVAPYLLSSSDVQGYAMQELLAMADDSTRALWDNLTLGYTETAGHPLLREEIALLYATTTADDVLCCVSAEEAIYLVMRLLVREGDHIIVTFPGYQSSYSIAASVGATVSYLRLRPAGDGARSARWQIDLDELRSLVRPNTQLIAVNFPNNPTGALLTRAEWNEVVAVAQDAGCYLLADEVYRLMEYDAADRLPAAVDCFDRAISVGAMSKAFGLAGLRVGWLASRDRDLLAQALAYKDYTTICGSAPSEVLALIALRARQQVLVRCLGIIQANLALADGFMAEHADWFTWVRPQAGSIAFPQWRGALPMQEFCDALMRAEGVMLLPGSVFDYPGKHFRLGLGRTHMAEALAKLKRFVRSM